jgi:lysophospholipase L1-like esterase
MRYIRRLVELFCIFGVAAGKVFSQGADIGLHTPAQVGLWFESEVSALEEGLRRDSLSGPPVIFYGSSSIRLWKTLAQDFSGYQVLNCGFGGSRFVDCLRFLKRLVFSHKPAAVVLYAGDNDLASGMSPEHVFNTFQEVFKAVRAYSASLPIGVISVKPSPARIEFIDQIEKLNQLLKSFLAQQPGTEFIDVYSVMLGSDHRPIGRLFQSDQVHLSSDGYAIWRKEVSEFLLDELPLRALRPDHK